MNERIDSTAAPAGLSPLQIPGLTTDDVGTLLNTNNFRYYKTMREQIQKNICPFCTIDHNLNKILYQNDRFMLWDNPVAKKDPAIERHIVMPVRWEHVTDPLTLTPEYGVSLFSMWEWACSEFALTRGALVIRFGKVKYNASSIRHLHANIKVPTGKMLRFDSSIDKLLNPNKNTTLYQNDHWYTWENRVVRGEASIAKRLVVCPRGILPTEPQHLTAEQGAAFIDSWLWAIRKWDLPGGAVVIRHGEKMPLYADIITPNGTLGHKEPLAENLTETFAKDPDDQARKMPIMLVFERMYQLALAGENEPFERLELEEKALVKDRL